MGELRHGSHLRASFHSFRFCSFATLAPPLHHAPPPPPPPPPLFFCLFTGYMGVAGRRMMTRRSWTCHPRRERSYSSGRIPCRMRCLRQVRSGWRSPVKNSVPFLSNILTPTCHHFPFKSYFPLKVVPMAMSHPCLNPPPMFSTVCHFSRSYTIYATSLVAIYKDRSAAPHFICTALPSHPPPPSPN